LTRPEIVTNANPPMPRNSTTIRMEIIPVMVLLSVMKAIFFNLRKNVRKNLKKNEP
jgi:hypothetical protein